MKIIYLVAAHYAPERYGDLLEALGPAVVITHVDKKVDAAPFHQAAAQHPGVIFVPDSDRVRVLWGGWSQVAATLAMLAAARPYIEAEDYVILLSGDSFPLQRLDGITAYLEAGGAAQYINSVSLPSKAVNKSISRVSRAYLEYDPRNGKMNLARRGFNKIGLRRNYKGALAGRQPRAGSTWWACTGAAVLWMLDDIKRDERFTRFCRFTKMPDEFFFQTILGHSPYAGDVRPGVMFADWSRPSGPKPAILDDQHVDNLVAGKLVMSDGGYGVGAALYARKVVDTAIAARIRVEIWPVKPAGIDVGGASER
jgi:hypothetical protein